MCRLTQLKSLSDITYDLTEVCGGAMPSECIVLLYCCVWDSVAQWSTAALKEALDPPPGVCLCCSLHVPPHVCVGCIRVLQLPPTS